jgi:hypothetical protein
MEIRMDKSLMKSRPVARVKRKHGSNAREMRRTQRFA